MAKLSLHKWYHREVLDRNLPTWSYPVEPHRTDTFPPDALTAAALEVPLGRDLDCSGHHGMGRRFVHAGTPPQPPTSTERQAEPPEEGQRLSSWPAPSAPPVLAGCQLRLQVERQKRREGVCHSRSSTDGDITGAAFENGASKSFGPVLLRC